MRTGSPMSSTKISPPLPMAPVWMTSRTASGMVMKKRVMRSSVTVTGPPAAICRLKSGTTLPLEPSTLPKRTDMSRVSAASRAMVSTMRSESALESPMTVSGSTALSVEMNTKRPVPKRMAFSTIARVAKLLLSKASAGLCCIIGTCL